MVVVNIVCLASCPESQHARDRTVCVYCMVFVTRDLSLSHTDVRPPLSLTPSATVEYTRLHLRTLRIAGRESNVLLTDVSRWPMIHTVHVCVMMTIRTTTDLAGRTSQPPSVLYLVHTHIDVSFSFPRLLSNE